MAMHKEKGSAALQFVSNIAGVFTDFVHRDDDDDDVRAIDRYRAFRATKQRTLSCERKFARDARTSGIIITRLVNADHSLN